LIGHVPQAVVYHHIPPARMSVSYIRKWAWHAGGAEMYQRWWNRKRSLTSLAKEVLAIGWQYWREWLKDWFVRRRRDQPAIETQYRASLGWCKCAYIWWMLSDPVVKAALDMKEHRL
jgi:hypothetical protein